LIDEKIDSEKENEMNTFPKSLPAIGLCLLLAAFAFSSPVLQENQTNSETLYKEIAGSYEFNVDGEIEVLVFFVKDGKLWGREENDYEEVEIVPTDLQVLTFEGKDNDGQYYFLQFSRDDNHKITKCLVTTQGMDIEGIRIKG